MLAWQRLGHWTLTWLVRRLVTKSPDWRFSTLAAVRGHEKVPTGGHVKVPTLELI